MNITRAWTNERFLLPIDLTSWMLVYPSLSTARFVAQIRTAAIDPVIMFGWDTQGSPSGFNGSAKFYAASSSIPFEGMVRLVLFAPSQAIAEVFHPNGGDFVWEFGFFDPASPNDYIRIDGGSCHFEPGVVRG